MGELSEFLTGHKEKMAKKKNFSTVNHCLWWPINPLHSLPDVKLMLCQLAK